MGSYSAVHRITYTSMALHRPALQAAAHSAHPGSLETDPPPLVRISMQTQCFPITSHGWLSRTPHPRFMPHLHALCLYLTMPLVSCILRLWQDGPPRMALCPESRRLACRHPCSVQADDPGLHPSIPEGDHTLGPQVPPHQPPGPGNWGSLCPEPELPWWLRW